VEPEAVDEAAGYPAEEEEVEASSLFARAAAATSVGSITALLPRGERSTEPPEDIVSGFIARKDWVYIMFSAAYDWAQLGTLLRSMLPPHMAAEDWLAVILAAYDMAA